MAELVAITLLMGLILVGLLVAIPRLGARANRRYSGDTAYSGDTVPARRGDEQDDLFTRIETVGSGIVNRPTMWYLAFFVLSIGLAGGAIFYVSAPDISATLLEAIGMAVAGLLGVLLTVFLFLGTFYAVRGRGRGNAEATLLGFSVLGTVLMIVILVILVIG